MVSLRQDMLSKQQQQKVKDVFLTIFILSIPFCHLSFTCFILLVLNIITQKANRSTNILYLLLAKIFVSSFGVKSKLLDQNYPFKF